MGRNTRGQALIRRLSKRCWEYYILISIYVGKSSRTVGKDWATTSVPLLVLFHGCLRLNDLLTSGRPSDPTPDLEYAPTLQNPLYHKYFQEPK